MNHSCSFTSRRYGLWQLAQMMFNGLRTGMSVSMDRFPPYFDPTAVSPVMGSAEYPLGTWKNKSKPLGTMDYSFGLHRKQNRVNPVIFTPAYHVYISSKGGGERI